MKFVIDAHLPRRLCRVFAAAGHDAVHTSTLVLGNQTSDGLLNSLAEEQQRVVVSKDSDFYYSHVLHGRPAKLGLVRVGRMRAIELIALFENHMTEISITLESSSLIEIDRSRRTKHG